MKSTRTGGRVTGRALPALLAGVPLGFMAVFFVYPVVALLGRGLTSGIAESTISPGRVGRVLWFTVWQAGLSTTVTMLIALPATWAVANFVFRGRTLVTLLVTVPFVLPTMVVASAFVALADRLGLDGGPFSLRHSLTAILAAHVFFNIAVVVRTVGGFWRGLDRGPEQAARTLGADARRTFTQVTWPRLRPAVLSAMAIVFLFSLTSFAIILVLGGPRRSTLETEIFRYAVTRADVSTAAMLALTQIVAVVAVVVANSVLARRAARREGLTEDRAKRPGTRRERIGLGLSVGLTLAALGMPVLAMVERSLRADGSISAANYVGLAERSRLLPISAARAVVNSLGFAVIAVLIAGLVGALASLVIARGPRSLARVTDLTVMLPLGTSAVTVGLGILIALDRGILDLRGSPFIIPIVQALIAIPFVVRSVVPVLRAIDPAVREAAATLGATPRAVWREIDMSIGSRALATGIGFGFAISLGEFGATSFVGRDPDLMTVPLAIERLLSTPGHILRGQAMALAVVLMVITVAAVLVGDRFGTRGRALL